MNDVSRWFGKIEDVLATPLFQLGGDPFTLWSLVYVAILTVALFYAAGRIRTWMSAARWPAPSWMPARARPSHR